MTLKYLHWPRETSMLCRTLTFLGKKKLLKSCYLKCSNASYLAENLSDIRKKGTNNSSYITVANIQLWKVLLVK